MNQFKSNLCIILLTVVVVATVAVGAVYFWNNEKKSNTPDIATGFQNLLPATYIENGVVFYINADGEKKIIAESNTVLSGDYILYKKASLSPNKKFILLGSYAACPGNECPGYNKIEVYDIAAGKTYGAEENGGSGFAEWLLEEGSKLRIVGECGMGISCGIFVSKDSSAPWILEKVEYR